MNHGRLNLSLTTPASVTLLAWFAFAWRRAWVCMEPPMVGLWMHYGFRVFGIQFEWWEQQ